MMKTVHLAIFDTYSDWEVGYATAYIHRRLWQRELGNWQVKTVGISADPVTSMGGLRVATDVLLDELSPADSAMLILPGADTWESGELAPFARKAEGFLAAGVPVAAICGATFGLAKAGLLDDRSHTSNAAEYLAFSGYSGGEKFVYEPAVTDGDLITGSGTMPVEFAREIFAKLDMYEPHVLEAWYRLYGHNDPAGFYALDEYEKKRAAESGEQ
ncbi:type 1 glutamine amidotransferase family protein [Nocardia sp. NPDC051030]|uniref:type 1 glutamine amidotransferase family protein n=1 Tax=Nocardia sp. NPDC051030 TaxID=3155162 RepID=UPI00343874DF